MVFRISDFGFWFSGSGLSGFGILGNGFQVGVSGLWSDNGKGFGGFRDKGLGFRD